MHLNLSIIEREATLTAAINHRLETGCAGLQAMPVTCRGVIMVSFLELFIRFWFHWLNTERNLDIRLNAMPLEAGRSTDHRECFAA